MIWGIKAAQAAPVGTHEQVFSQLGSQFPLIVVSMGVVWVLYYSIMESSPLQATVGKMIMGMRVKTIEGKRLSILQGIIRQLSWYLSALPFGIGLAMVGWTQKKQGLHDILVKTVVVDNTPKNFLYTNPEVTTVHH
jgi:uncharacterized RDD family membrane protein YckC